MIWLWLAKMIGVKRLTGWAVRGLVLALLLVLVVVVIAVWALDPDIRPRIIGSAFGVVIVLAFRAWRKRGNVQEPEAEEPGERTIEGKVVPEILAAAALEIPRRSPDGEYVLRGLPDYGKALLRLDGAAFEYVPPLPELEAPTRIAPPALLLEKPAKATGMSVPRWALGLAIAVVGIGSWLFFMHQDSGSAGRVHARIVDASSSEPHTGAGYGESAPSAPDPAPHLAEMAREGLGGNDSQQPPAAPHSATGNGEASPPAPGLSPEIVEAARRALSGNDSSPVNYLRGTWRDSKTGLLWPKTDNGPKLISSLTGAKRYCESLNVDGITNWRVPSALELMNVVSFSGPDDRDVQFVGAIQSTETNEMIWLSDGEQTIGPPLPNGTHTKGLPHVLCVHD
jgi:hypothetical protein